ncbi:MAG TPA: hypothetical protein VMQ61_14545 [Thermoanaerobaculia bacterium]|nr:hypothetical protein [Thermoanaerobaculia bacterium]
MKRLTRLIPMLLVFGFLDGSAARAQMAKRQEMKPPTARVTLVRIAPGKHLEFLKWAAENEAIAKEAGVPATQVYEHTNGDAWDYMQIAPDLTDAQQAKVDEVTKKHGGKTGLAASLEFRTFVAWHTDTDTIGPVSAAELVAAAGK